MRGVESVKIEPSLVVFPPTYVDYENKFVVSITNLTTKTLDCEWRQFSNSSEEQEVLSSYDLGDPSQRLASRDAINFNSPVFRFENPNFSLWPKVTQKMVVYFKPSLNKTYSTNAYLFVAETGERIAIRLQGHGLSPEASFDVTSINVGHVNLDSILEYEVNLVNVGKVKCEFEAIQHESHEINVSFTPNRGSIDVGAQVPIRVKLIAARVGPFTESFPFKIKGCSGDMPKLLLHGRIAGPVFSTNVRRLAFDRVSTGFLYSKTFEIENKSDIPFDYCISLSHDGRFQRREFSISPQEGVIPKFTTQTIKVEFIPETQQLYDLKLFIDIANYGEKMITIPITAESISPHIDVVHKKIKLGNIFIGQEYKNKIELIDSTDLPAKYEYVVPTDSTVLQAKFDIIHTNGVVKANSVSEIPFSIVSTQLGPMHLTQYLKIHGSEEPLKEVVIEAVCTGPNIVFSQNSVDFGKIHVLKKTTKQFVVTNDSTIEAEFEASISQDGKCFSVSQSNGRIEPGQSITMSVDAILDDTINFKAKLIFTFKYLNPIIIDITAVGTGTTIVPSIPLPTLDMDYMFTEVPNNYIFTLENKGRRAQDIRWATHKPKISASGNCKFLCKIAPDAIIIKPGCSASFTITTQCNIITSFTDIFQCSSTIGRQRIDLFNLNVKGSFINPSVTFSKQVVEFKHVHDSLKEEDETGLLMQSDAIEPPKDLFPVLDNDFDIKNNSKLPLTVSVDCQVPFSISETNFKLMPQESKNLTVLFDPSVKTDYSCEVISNKLIFSYKEHPNKSSITLSGSLVFPNVIFQPADKIDFGILLFNTEQQKDVIMKNPTELPVDFVWEIFPGPNNQELSNIFDIFPIRGHIDPFSSEKIHFNFFAQSSAGKTIIYNAVSVCHIVGGPDYTMKLTGGSANIKYKIEPSSIDLGNVNYLENITTQVTLTNLCEVPLTYSAKIPKGSKLTTFLVSPPDGTLNVGMSQAFNLILTPGLPMEFNESLFVRIGHFDDVRIDLHVNAFIPQAFVSLPRHPTDPLKIEHDKEVNRRISEKNRIKEAKESHREEESDSEEDIENEEDDYAEIEKKLLISKLTTKNTFADSLRMRRRKGEPTDCVYNNYVASRFLADMGKIVFGKKEVCTFTIKSISPSPISFEINDQILKETGFSIDKRSFKDVPPGESIEINISFDTKQKANESLGDVEYQIPIIFSEDYAYIIHLTADLETPVLNLSQKYFDFGTTIVGQKFIMTLQLQNMNNVPVEYKFDNAQYINVLQRSLAKDSQNAIPFAASPSSGLLPPASFQNIDISFMPMQEKSFSMQFPIEIKHNSQPLFVTLKGVGVQLKVTFDPPEIICPPLLPFSEPTMVDVNLVNPTQYPIEVMANQFDLQLLIEEERRKRLQGTGIFNESSEQEIKPVSIYTQETHTSISKFSICAIVHGPKYSGKTTVSNEISKYLGNAPIISLKDVWKDLLTNEEATQADFVSTFANLISNQKYAEGFVVDGLDVLPEPEESEAFYTHCIKIKKVWDEVVKNPLGVYQHQFLTAAEQALAYVLAALDGNYVFFVGLNSDEDTLYKREEAFIQLDRRRKRHQAHVEREMLFKMTEEEYMALDEEKRNEVDRKRSEYRKRTLRRTTEAAAAAAESKSGEASARRSKKGSHSSSKDKDKEKGDSRRKHSSSKEKEKEADKKKRDNKKKSSKDQVKEEEERIRLRQLKGMPKEPIQRSLISFLFTIGSLVQRVKDGGDMFAAINPYDITKNSSMSSAMTSMKYLPAQGEPIAQPVITSLNSVLIDVNRSIDEVFNSALSFIPQLNQIKEKAFTRLIAPPKIILPDPSTYRKEKLLQMPKHFSIFNEEPFTVEEVNSSHSVRPDSTLKSGRKSKIRKDRNNEQLFPDDYDLSKRTPRWKIDPNSSQTISIRFEAELVGTYKDSLTFSLLNGKSDIAKLRVSGVCAYPDITRDIKLLFPKRVPKIDLKTQMSYVTTANMFYFGSLLVVKDKGGKNAVPGYKQTIMLSNPSLFPVEVSAFLADQGGKKAFVIDTPTLNIEPGESKEFSFSAIPTNPELIKNAINLHIKDQPEPFTFPIAIEGCQPTLDVETTSFDFGKLLLTQNKTLNFELKNTGKLPVYWCLKGVHTLGPNFSFNQEEGTMNPRQTFVVVCKYASKKPFSIKKPLTLEVYDLNKERMFSSKQIMVSAESFEVNFDFQYQKGLDHLQFGALKVGQPKTIVATLKNKGKYPSTFKFSCTPARLNKLFTITPQEGVITSSERPLNISFTFSSPKLVNYANAKGITLSIIDNLSNQVTETLPIPFSAQTVFSQFQISNTDKIDFGALAVGTSLVKQITIDNKGAFPFEFNIEGKQEPQKEPQKVDTKKRLKPMKSPSQSSIKRKKGMDKGIFVGNYTVAPSTAVVSPGNSVTIDIEFSSQTEGKFDNTILVSITDANPNKTSFPIPIDLTANAYVPTIITDKFEQIFIGPRFCLRYDIKNEKTTAFLEDDHVLFFAPQILQAKAETTMRLTNPLPIPCVVDCNMKPNGKGKAAIANFPFNISEKVITIEPESSTDVTLSFAPNVVDNFSATFEATVRGNNTPNKKTLKFGLEGAGTLPAIKMQTILDKPGKNGIYNVNLGKTLIGFVKEKNIAVYNDGLIPAKISISANASPDFELAGVDSTQEFTLEVGRNFVLPIVYAPQKARKGQFDIRLSVIDNPKSDIAISVFGEGFSEDIIFEGLRNDEPDLYFKDNVVGRQQQATFVMRNVSSDDIRFQWSSNPDFTFSPSFGHLRVGSRKVITVTFFSDKPVKHNGVKVNCQWTKIKLQNPNSHDWDDTHKTIKFVSRGSLKKKEQPPTPEKKPKKGRKSQISKVPEVEIPDPDDDKIVKVVEIAKEPENEPIPGKYKDLCLRVFAVSDFIKYQIDTADVAFSPTMMFQKRIVEAKLTNTSQIRFDYTWSVTQFKTLKNDYHSSKIPFTVTPRSGFIEAGSSTVFQVAFEPDEVEDFNAVLLCEIPYLSHLEPPKITVSGISRRPLCHFNVEMSDYLEAGRRHPDYTNPLPEHIRVIELFSRGVGIRATKKFEVINPTSSSYEINWEKISNEEGNPIHCDTPAALVSSGKRYMVSFSFTPTSVKTVESQWIFRIPEHNVKVDFLIVGRIVPK